MRYADLPRLYAAVQVISPPVRRGEMVHPPALPEAGARWGKASAFSWSRQAASEGRGRQERLTVEYPEPAPRAFMRVVEAEARIMSERVRIEAPDDPSRWVEVDRMTRMAFAWTEFPPKPQTGSPQPSLTTVYDLAFALHPEDETVVQT